ncbi:peptidase S8/S53 domain-containing protein, partial [Blastocladiella britannica]
MKALGSQPSPPSWGLIRTGERNLDLSQGYNYPDEAGSGITVYVVDTGIDVTHPEFEGRASWGNTACSGCASKDDHGHGTHCAGTIGGKTFGVAKKVKVVAVKVLGADGSGTDADVIAGINWAANAAKATGKPGVLSMSLGGGKSDTLDQAVKAAIAGGATFAVAAGNDSTSGSEADACEGSPSGVAEAIVVGATDKTDARAYFSDTGKCVSIFAPGVSILSAKPGGGSQSMDGTSMATPHVAGVAAIVLSQDSTLTPAQVKAAIVNGATAGKVKNPGNGSPNKLLFNAVIGAPSTSTTATSTSSSTTKTSSTTTKT